MGKKGKGKGKYASKDHSAANDGSQKRGEGFLAEGETFLEDGRCEKALACFEEAVKLLPTNQTAWYHRGVAAAELWEDTAPSNRERVLQLACQSFNRVFELDTSRRSETRYLSNIALAQLLAHLADLAVEEQLGDFVTQPVPDTVLAESVRNFEEAANLQAQWNHEPFDDEAWGAWGQAIALQMQTGIAAAESRAQTVGQSDWGAGVTLAELEGAATLCAAAADKFSKATASKDVSSDGAAGDDVQWLTLHVEHLLRFVDLMRRVLTSQRQDKDSHFELCWSRARTAYKEAATLTVAITQLVGGASWEPSALRGDVFAAAANLLGGVAQIPNATTCFSVTLPQIEIPVATGNQTEGWEVLSPAQWGINGQELDAAQAIALAEAAYSEALQIGSQDAFVRVTLQIGELQLGVARRSRCEDRLRIAAEAYQTVATCEAADSESRVEALYNIACIAGLLGKPDKAAEALQASLGACRSDPEREKILREARSDSDLIDIITHPGVVAILSAVLQ